MAKLYGPGPGSPPALVSTADLAGLSASDVEGSPVGELVGALSEERTGLIRYLDVAIRHADKHVLVPIGHARIDRASVPPRVRLRAATHEDLLSVPHFAEGETPLDAGYQDEVLNAHGRLFYGSFYYAHPAYDHSALHAGESPIIGAAAPTEGEGLRSISEEEESELAEGVPALVGSAVIDADGDDVGTIRDLLVSAKSHRPRYVVIELESLERPVALPVGYIRAERDEDRVRIPALTVEDVALLPPYEPPLTRAEENRLHAAIEGRLSGPRYFDRADFRPTSLE